jgi:hypothetical protein
MYVRSQCAVLLCTTQYVRVLMHVCVCVCVSDFSQSAQFGKRRRCAVESSSSNGTGFVGAGTLQIGIYAFSAITRDTYPQSAAKTATQAAISSTAQPRAPQSNGHSATTATTASTAVATPAMTGVSTGKRPASADDESSDDEPLSKFAARLPAVSSTTVRR